MGLSGGLATNGTRGGQVSASVASAASQAVNVAQAQRYSTLNDLSQSLQHSQPPPFTNRPASANAVVVSPAETFQEFLGVGGALTDSAANLLWQMSPAQRTAILTEMFSPSQANWGTVRICLGTSDFRTGALATYDENSGSADTTLANFNLQNAGDLTYIIPILQEIVAINPRVRIIGSPWFPPLWIRNAVGPPTGTPGATPSNSGGTLATASYFYKITALFASGAESKGSTETAGQAIVGTTGSVALTWNAVTGATGYRVYRGTATGAQSVFYAPGNVTSFTDTGAASTGGTVPTQAPAWDFNITYYQAYANYLVKAIQGYQALGIPIYGITPQNEPQGGYTRFSSAQMITFIGTWLGPALDAAGLETKIIAVDDDWGTDLGNSVLPFAQALLADATAGPFIDSCGWHCYSGVPTTQNTIRRQYRSVGHHVTEMRNLAAESNPTQAGIMAADIMIGATRNWAKSLTLWNVCLDENGGPQTTGVGGRLGVVTINSSTFAVTRNLAYYVLRHLSQFIQPGARRCASTSGPVGHASANVQTVAVVNPDQSVVLLAFNNTANVQTFTIHEGRGGTGFPVTLQPYEMSTFVWGTYAQALPAGSAQSTPVLVATTSQVNAANATTVTWSHVVPADLPTPAVVVAVALAASGGVNSPQCSGVTYGGQAMTLLGRGQQTSSTGRTIELWGLVNPPTGGSTVLASASGSVPLIGQAFTFTGVSQGTPFGTAATQNASANSPSVNTTGGSVGDVVLAALSVRANTGASAPVTPSTQQPVYLSLFGTNFQLASSVQPGGTGTIASSFSWVTPDNEGLVAVAVHGA